MPTRPSRFRIAVAAALTCASTAGAGVAVATGPAAPAPATVAPGEFAAGHVLVHYADGVAAADQHALEHANGASRVGSVPDVGVDVLQVPDGTEQRVVDALQRSGKVDYAELDAVAHADMTVNDPYWSQQWGLAKMNVPTAWDASGDASSAAPVVVAVLDSGVDAAQPDLQGRLLTGWDFVNNDGDPNDDRGHGTATTGVIGADTDNGIGIAGTCLSCMLLPVKVLDAQGSGSYSGIAQGLTWAVDQGARIINMSLSSSTDSSTLHSAVQYAVAHGAIVVGSAGNNGNSTPVYPAAYPEALSVAGTTSSDALYSWSDFGSWVDVAAPGCTYATRVGGDYSSFCGTSASAPFVSGILALMICAEPMATEASMLAQLESTAVPIGDAVRYGRIDAAAAVAAASGADAAPEPSPSPSVAPTETPAPSGSTITSTFTGTFNNKVTSRSFSVTAGDGSLTAELRFSRAPSMLLRLVTASGATAASASGGSPQNLSAAVAAGGYTLVVSSASKGSFSLSVSYPSP